MADFANKYFPRFPNGTDPTVAQEIRRLYERVNVLTTMMDTTRRDLEKAISKGIAGEQKSNKLEVALATVQDTLTQGTTFVDSAAGAMSPTTQISGGGIGYSFSQNSAGVLTMTVSNAALARSSIDAAVDGHPAGAPATLTLFKITGGGTDGSITIGVDGTITAFVAPT